MKIHCATCHRVAVVRREDLDDPVKRRRVSWVLDREEDGNGARYCSSGCYLQRKGLKRIYDPLPIPTPYTGSYEFKLGFWACAQGYHPRNWEDEYQAGYTEALVLRNRYYTRR